MKKKYATVNDMARDLVGDGKSPNLFFVTVAFGWYKPADKEDMVQVKNALESITIGPFDSDEAEMVYASFRKPFTCNVSNITGQTITQVMIEDRKTGVVKEWGMEQSKRDGLCRPFDA